MYLEKNGPHLINVYDPDKEAITLFNNNERAKVADDIYIFYEKNMYQVSQSNSIYSIEKVNYDEYKKEYADLDIWIQEYKKAHQSDHTFSVFYEDDNLTIYHLHHDIPESDIINTIWS